jgi:hypothetical protein
MPSNGRRILAAVATFFSIIALTSCSSVQAPVSGQRAVIMKSASGATVSSFELRRRIDDTVPRFIGKIETAADRIREESDDPVVRRRSLEWKLDAVQAVQYAAFQADLAVAALDLWLLTVQMDDAFTTGAASDWFGEQQPIAQNTAHELRAQIESYAAHIARSPEAFQEAKAFIHETATSNPVDARVSRRASIATVIGTLKGESPTGAFAVAREVADSVGELSNHLNSYMTTVPKLGRWHAELMTEEMAMNLGLPEAVADVRRLAIVAEGSEALAPGAIGNALDGAHAIVTAERIALLREIDRQRLDTLVAISGERTELLKAITAERQASLEALHVERLETIESVEQMRKRLIDEAGGHLIATIDHLALRMAQLLVAASACVVVALLVLRRAPRA